MKGATNTIASASASGITRIAATKQKVAISNSNARSINGDHCPRGTCKDRPKLQINGAINAHCTTKRAAVICPTGTLVDASLADTSNIGAVTQKPSINATPVRFLSVGGAEGSATVLGSTGLTSTIKRWVKRVKFFQNTKRD